MLPKNVMNLIKKKTEIYTINNNNKNQMTLTTRDTKCYT